MKLFVAGGIVLLTFAGCKKRNFGEPTDSSVKDNSFQYHGDVKDGKELIDCKKAEKSEFDLRDKKLKIKFSEKASAYWSKEMNKKIVYLHIEGAATQSMGQPVLAIDLQDKGQDLQIELVKANVNQLVVNTKAVFGGDEDPICKINGTNLRNGRLQFELDDCGDGKKHSLVFENCELNKDNLKKAQKLLN